MSTEAQQGTNTGAEKDKFDRIYRAYNPAPAQGPTTEVIATILKPQGS